MNSTEWTFWRFLKENEIEIPIIQRDYAQGRVGKEELRKSFLRDIKESLGTNKRMKLDFVYGTNENGVLIPLDGQQRLTTLWLLHWYVAYRAQKLDEPTIERLRKFSYKTRLSSRQFCEKLAGFGELPSGDLDVASHIRNQIWFRRSWQHDPTIQSLLRMLGGTLDDSLDGIDGVFKCNYIDCLECRRPIYDEYWELLTSEDCPIVFHHVNLPGIRHPDSLYIKMNARGKPLTSFENFKADLMDHIARKEELEKTDDWRELANLERGFAIKFDRDWINNIFWPSRIRKGADSDLNNGLWDGRVDDIAFAFFNRFCANEIVISMKDNKTKFGDCPAFDYFYGRFLNEKKEDSQSDSRIAYTGFSHFVACLGSEQLRKISRIFENYSKFERCSEKQIGYSRYGDAFEFVPQYIKKNGKNNQDGKVLDFANTEIPKISEITQKGRIFFYAFCAYFANPIISNDASEASIGNFEDWMRVVWNIVKNSDVNTIDSMISCLQLIHVFSGKSHYILSFLKGQNTSPDCGTKKGREQVAEEIEKAKRILCEDGSLRKYEGQLEEFRGKAWKDVIDHVEQECFFDGSIRFLFTDGNGKVNWDEFDTKYLNTKKYFDQKGVSQAFRTNALLLRAFLARLGESNLTEKFWFGNGADFWRNQVLLNAEFNSVVSELLLTEITHDNAIPEDAPAWIADNTLLSDAIEKDNDPNGQWHIVTDWIRGGNDDKTKTLTRYSRREKGNVNYPWQIIPLLRNELLDGLISEQRRGTCYFIGWTINFLYNDRWFQWRRAPSNDGKNIIYLLKNDWKNQIEPREEHQEDPDKQGDERTYYCFMVEENETQDSFRSNLDKRIQHASKQTSVSP